MDATHFSLDSGHGDVSAAWSTPRQPRATLVVAPGAGFGYDAPFLVSFTRGMNDGGVATLRFNFPYREQGKKAPNPERVLRATWLAAFGEAVSRSASGARVLAGGKSLGGRIASLVVADGMPAAGLVFLGYPLHPPGDPTSVRDEHLYRIGVPMLFLQGTRDPFAQTDRLAPVLSRLGGRASLVPFEGGDHSFHVSGGVHDDEAVGASLAAPTVAFIEGLI